MRRGNPRSGHPGRPRLNGGRDFVSRLGGSTRTTASRSKCSSRDATRSRWSRASAVADSFPSGIPGRGEILMMLEKRGMGRRSRSPREDESARMMRLTGEAETGKLPSNERYDASAPSKVLPSDGLRRSGLATDGRSVAESHRLRSGPDPNHVGSRAEGDRRSVLRSRVQRHRPTGCVR